MHNFAAKKEMARFFLSLFCIFLSFSSFAGVVKGTVVEDKNSLPVVNASVAYKPADSTVKGNTGGAVTDIDGKFELSGIKNGEYIFTISYLTFITEKRTVKVEGNDIVLEVRMKELEREMKSVEITAKKISNTETAVINEIKTSNAVVSGTSSSQISKSMDRNAADVVKRIPGVTIQDDRFVVIRGLPDRYNTVWLNDAGAPSSEADKKSFSFDIIPSGLIDRVLIFKTPSPELPGDFAGGMVKVYTTSLQDKNQLSISLQSSSRDNTTGKPFNYNQSSKTDWLGYDDGSRGLPAGTPDRVNKSDIGQDHTAISKAFGNDWSIKTKTATPDMRFGMSYSGVLKLNKVKIGNTFGITYTSTETNNTVNRQDWDSVTSRNYDYNDHIYSKNVGIGILENAGISIGNSKIEFKNLYSQIGKSTLLMRTTGADSSQNPEKDYAMGYDSKATYSAQLSGTHKKADDSRRYTWTLGYNDVFKNQPDLRRIKYTRGIVGTDTFFKAAVTNAVDANFGGGRYYSSLYEKIYSFNHQFSQKIKVNDKFTFTVNAGNYIELKRRALNIRKFSYTINSSAGNGAHADSLKKLDINNIFADQNINSKGFVMDEGTDTYDKYTAKNDLYASFISLNVPVGKHINVVGGARYESNKQSLVGYVGTDTLRPELKSNFLLPSVNLSYNFTDKSLVRAAYGKTLNRPEFREFAPVVYYDFEDLALIKGSLQPTNSSPNGDTLKVSEIHNFDLRYEFYPSSGEMIHIGVFYKTINNAIIRVIDPFTSGDNKTLTFINGSKAYSAGLELDIRKNLVFIDNKLGTNFFKNISFVGNLALSKSESKIDTTIKHYQIPSSTLQGQSPYVVNMGAYYQNDALGLKGSLLYNVYGARLYAAGTVQSGGESIGELPFQALDLTLSKLFKKHYLLNFGIQNLLDSKISLVKDSNKDGKFDSNSSDREYKTYKPGRYYTIGVKINF